MDIFISWSGDRSEAVANALYRTLPLIIQAAKPWMSREIEKGSRWDDVISAKLECCDFGIVCLTPESLESAWLLFEAGALSKKFKDTRVCTYLYDLQESDVRGPLGKFQHTQSNQSDTWRLISTINVMLPSPLPQQALARAFHAFWPDLESALGAISQPATAPRRRTTDDKIDEILVEVRNIVRRENAAREIEAKKRHIENLVRSHPIASLQDSSRLGEQFVIRPESYPFAALLTSPRNLRELREMKCSEHSLQARLFGTDYNAYQVDACCLAFLDSIREKASN